MINKDSSSDHFMKYIVFAFLFLSALFSNSQVQSSGDIYNQGWSPAKVQHTWNLPVSPTTPLIEVLVMDLGQKYRWTGSIWYNIDSMHLQTLSVLGNQLTIRDGNTITMPSSFSKLYDKSGLLSSNAVPFIDTFYLTSATPTISLSSYLSVASCTNFKLNSVTAYRSGASAGNSPNITVTALTSNSISFIITQPNPNTISILGINVISVPTVVVPDPTNVKLVLSFTMY